VYYVALLSLVELDEGEFGGRGRSRTHQACH
jgi:hypothetical protein